MTSNFKDHFTDFRRLFITVLILASISYLGFQYFLPMVASLNYKIATYKSSLLPWNIQPEIEEVESLDEEFFKQRLSDTIIAENKMDKKVYVGPIVKKISAEPIAKKISVEPIAKKISVEPIAKVIVVKPIAKEIIVEPIAKKISVEPIAKKISAEPIAKQISVEPIAKKISVEPIAKKISVEPIEKVISLEPIVKKIPVEPIAREISLEPIAIKTSAKPKISISTKKPLVAESNAKESPVAQSTNKTANLVKSPAAVIVQKPVESEPEDPFFDDSLKISYPWSNHKCKEFSVRYAKRGMLKSVALVSYPGSGNHWVQYLLEGSTGIFTTSLYPPHELDLNGKPIYPTYGRTIAYQTHHGSQRSNFAQKSAQMVEIARTREMCNYRGILIIRNPYKALRSHWNYRLTRDHLSTHELPNTFNPTGWASLLRSGAANWATLIKIWLANSSEYIIVLYEDLQKDTKSEIIRMLKFLKVPIDEKRLDCVISNKEGPFHRKSSNNAMLEFINSDPALDAAIQESIAEVNQLFKKKKIGITLNYKNTV